MAGTSLHLDGDALRVVHPEKPGRNLIPLVRLDHIVAWNGVNLSDDLLHRCAADGRSGYLGHPKRAFPRAGQRPADRQSTPATSPVPGL
ncbi:MAG: hypothetical protein ACRDRX_27550 [Pseudonocardiaceae bacterium]